MKYPALAFSFVALVALACGLFTPVPQTAPVMEPTAPPQKETVPQPEEVPTPALPPQTGQPYNFEYFSFNIPDDIAGGATGQNLPPLTGDDMPPWEVTPGHLEIRLEGYALSEKFHAPRLYVFPVVGLAAVQPGAAENISRLQEILAGPGTPLSIHDLPGIHFFNAATVFASNAQVIHFQNGSGVRALAVFGQYYAPVNNHDLFYHFQGLTSNGQYYIIAILPITHPGLQADSNPGSMPVDAGFPSYPDYTTASDVEMKNYYSSMTDLLNNARPEIFTPNLARLDRMIESIQITP